MVCCQRVSASTTLTLSQGQGHVSTLCQGRMKVTWHQRVSYHKDCWRMRWHVRVPVPHNTITITNLYLYGTSRTSRLLIPYCSSQVLMSSCSSNLLQVAHTNLIFGSCSYCATAPTTCLTDSFICSKQLWILPVPRIHLYDKWCSINVFLLAGVVICLGRDADVQLTPLPLTVSCFSKNQIGFTFLVPAHPGNPTQNPESSKMDMCVCYLTAVI